MCILGLCDAATFYDYHTALNDSCNEIGGVSKKWILWKLRKHRKHETSKLGLIKSVRMQYWVIRYCIRCLSPNYLISVQRSVKCTKSIIA